MIKKHFLLLLKTVVRLLFMQPCIVCWYLLANFWSI